MEWSHDGPPNYVNWLYGQPEATENQYPGNTCGIIDKDAFEDDVNWSGKFSNSCFLIGLPIGLPSVLSLL